MRQRAPGAPRCKRRLRSRSANFASLVLLVGSVVAGVPGHANTVAAGKQAAPPHMPVKKAVMHVYSCTPKTLEITSVTSHFFKDVDACERTVGRALRAASSDAREGDLEDAQCVAIDPPETTATPKDRAFASGARGAASRKGTETDKRHLGNHGLAGPQMLRNLESSEDADKARCSVALMHPKTQRRVRHSLGGSNGDRWSSARKCYFR